MPRIFRTEPSKADVLSIFEYIATDNPTAAFGWIEKLDEALERLAESPFIGEQVDHLAKGVRRQCLGNYLIFYKPIDDGIEVRRVLHGARRIHDLLM
jgi:toxin ParE1/3/4